MNWNIPVFLCGIKIYSNSQFSNNFFNICENKKSERFYWNGASYWGVAPQPGTFVFLVGCWGFVSISSRIAVSHQSVNMQTYAVAIPTMVDIMPASCHWLSSGIIGVNLTYRPISVYNIAKQCGILTRKRIKNGSLYWQEEEVSVWLIFYYIVF